jgi:hypothetical protein
MFSGSLELADINEPWRHFRVVPIATERSAAQFYARGRGSVGTSQQPFLTTPQHG